MDNIQSMIARALGGSVVVYILMEIIQWTVVVFILYAVVKYAVKHAIYESRKEFNYTIRKALLESKDDIETKKEEIPDYRYTDYSELYQQSNEKTDAQRGRAHEKAEWIPKMSKEKDQNNRLI